MVAYEINAQGWKKRLGVEGVGEVQGGGGVYILKIAIAKGAVEFSYIIFFFGGGRGGKGFIHHTFLNYRPPTPLERNKSTVPSSLRPRSEELWNTKNKQKKHFPSIKSTWIKTIKSAVILHQHNPLETYHISYELQ